MFRLVSWVSRHTFQFQHSPVFTRHPSFWSRFYFIEICVGFFLAVSYVSFFEMSQNLVISDVSFSYRSICALTKLIAEAASLVACHLRVGSHYISFKSHVKSLGVYIDATLSVAKHIDRISRSAYLEIRRISSVRHLLTRKATVQLMCSFVLSRLD